MSTTMPQPCPAERADDPRFDYAGDTFNPPPGTWAPDCGHPACIEDARNCPSGDGWHGWDCPVAVCRWNAARDCCDLEADHDGEHRFQLPAPSARQQAGAVGGAGGG